MRTIFKYLLTICIIMTGLSVSAKEIPARNFTPKKSVAVLPSQYAYGGLFYFIYQEASEMLCLDTINILSNRPYANVLHLSEARRLISTQDKDMLSARYLNAYRNTLNLDYVPLRKISKIVGTDNLLIIATSVDTQTGFMQSTWWNFFNVPGADVVKPTYKVTAYVTLLNTADERVLWQKFYKRDLSEPDFGLAQVTYAPNTMQLRAFKDYSLDISKDIAYNVEKTLAPEYTDDMQPPFFRDKVKHNLRKKYDEHIENVNLKRAKKIQAAEDAEFAQMDKQIEQGATAGEGSVGKSGDGGEVNVNVSPINLIIPKL